MIDQGRAQVEISIGDMARQLAGLGVDGGGVLLVHTSFRQVRPVEDGPHGLIEALRMTLGDGGTLVMPSWTGDDDVPFDPATTPASPDLGVVADSFWRMPGVVRSTHPFACAAIGPLAAQIVLGSLPLPPACPGGPIGQVHALDGQVLLLGVGHDSNTTLHLAELMAEVPYRVPRHCTVLEGGRPVRIDYGENDHCCARFELADAWLRSADRQSEGQVGHAHARLFRSRDVVERALTKLKHDPLLFLHAIGSGCAECEEAHRSVTG